jgi:hypothetical protein
MEGMVNLAFILLGAKAAKGRETVAEKLWKFGSFILVKLIKKHNEAASTVLQRLTDCIITGQAVTQYTGAQHVITCTPQLLSETWHTSFVDLGLYMQQNPDIAPPPL